MLDEEHRRGFIACEANATLVVVDLETRKTRQSLPVGDDPDVLAYDTKRAVLYVAAESGTVSIFRTNADGLGKIGEGFLDQNAHIVAVNGRTHRIYFPVLGDAGPKLLVMQAR